MPNILDIDFEIFSEADLKEVGAYRYAHDPSTEILCCAVALNDGEPELWLPEEFIHFTDWYSYDEHEKAYLLLHGIHDTNTIIYAHNAPFEMAISGALWERTFRCPPPSVEQWRCTAAMARRAALPWSLGKLAEKLNLAQQKDNRGAALIRTFCIPQKKPAKKWKALGVTEGGRIMPHMAPDLFKEFCEYCKQDVRTEQAVHKALKKFEMVNMVLDVFHLDARINSRGLPVNLDALQWANNIVDAETERLNAEFSALTGLNTTQNTKFLEWLKERGYKADNLQAMTIDEELEGMELQDNSDPVKHALWLRKQFAFAAVKKIPKMLACAGPHDNKVRGTIIPFGAGPGRWSGALIQPQNFKRPTIKHTEQAYRDICDGASSEWLRIAYGNPLEVISSCIRHFIHDCNDCPCCPGDGWVFEDVPCTECQRGGVVEAPFIDADYNAIEARIVCWLAGQDDALEEYRNGLDRYCGMASLIYNKPALEIKRRAKLEDAEAVMERFIGKQCILGCGFGMGPPKYIVTCAKFGVTVELPLATVAVTAWRKRHPKVVSFWYDTERAAKAAILNPGTSYKAGRISFFSLMVAGLKYLFLRLPSGRTIAYPEVELVRDDLWRAYEQEMEELKTMDAATRVFLYGSEDGKPEPPKRKNQERITFYSQLPESTQWGRVDTYGGKLVENATQGCAADVMMCGALNLERQGYEIATLVHDQALIYCKPGQTAEEAGFLMKTLPQWADGLPVEVEAKITPFYKK